MEFNNYPMKTAVNFQTSSDRKIEKWDSMQDTILKVRK